MHRRQFLASLLALPLLGLPISQPEGISIGGWYFKGGSGLDCGTFLAFRAIIVDTTGGTGGLYTFFYDYLVDDEWLADFKESTAIFGCTKVEGGIRRLKAPDEGQGGHRPQGLVPNSIWLPMVVR